MEKKIKVLICRTSEKAELKEIDNKKRTLTEIVGGMIEPVFLCTNNIMMICNGEALIRKLPKNIAYGYADKQGLLERKEYKGAITNIIHGDCFFCSYDDENLPCSLTDEQIELLKNSLYTYKECSDEQDGKNNG